MIILTYITDINNSSYDVQTSMIFNTMMKKCHLNDHTRGGARSYLAKANAKANFFLSTQVYRISIFTRRTIEIAKNPLASDVAFAFGFA